MHWSQGWVSTHVSFRQYRSYLCSIRFDDSTIGPQVSGGTRPRGTRGRQTVGGVLQVGGFAVIGDRDPVKFYLSSAVVVAQLRELFACSAPQVFLSTRGLCVSMRTWGFWLAPTRPRAPYGDAAATRNQSGQSFRRPLIASKQFSLTPQNSWSYLILAAVAGDREALTSAPRAARPAARRSIGMASAVG